MSCNCDCLEAVDCTCPTLTGIDNAVAIAFINTTYDPAQSISGAGFNVVLYTNSSAVSQTVLVETNMYLIGTEATSLTTTTYTRSGVALTGAAIGYKEDTPLKSDHTHFLNSTTLAAGQDISIQIQGSLGAPTISWIKSVVYMT